MKNNLKQKDITRQADRQKEKEKQRDREARVTKQFSFLSVEH